MKVGQRFAFEAHNALLSFNLNRRKIAVSYSIKGGAHSGGSKRGHGGGYTDDLMEVDSDNAEGLESDGDDMASLEASEIVRRR